MYRKALDIKLEILPKTHNELAELYDMIARSLKRQGKISEATKMYKQLLASLLQIHGEDHVAVAVVYNGIAELLETQNRLDDAIQMLDKCIEICLRLKEVGDVDTSIVVGILRR
mmetsp:Transcript_36349/g.88042  ORF Transcript_36349/g.88042 Transcript_36349/m.88042 type:complete len:114 (-) Transcript_36349:159-500(-)